MPILDIDFEIEIQDENVGNTSNIEFPRNVLSFGEMESDDVKVYIRQPVYKALENLAASDTSKELGSILLGEYCRKNGETHVIISQYIEAKYTDASASTLTFTHETWDYIHREQEKHYPDQKIIGWQHTHPNYGIFLSNYDMFIQENFFNLPFQIAYVIDPIQNMRGFFQWKNGRVERLKGYYIYDDASKPIKIEQIRIKKETQPSDRMSRAAVMVLGLMLAVTLFLLSISVSLNRQYEKRLAQQEEITVQQWDIDRKVLLIQNQRDTIEKLQRLLVDDILTREDRKAAADLIGMVENKEIILENQNELLEKLKALLAAD